MTTQIEHMVNLGGHRLTRDGYWDKHYTRKSAARSRAYRTIRRVIGKRIADFYYYGGYCEQLLLAQIQKALPTSASRLRSVELGSAPGRRLVYWRDKLGIEPFGVEYTEHGVELNRSMFDDAGIPAENVIHADIFDPDFQHAHAESFDLVSSFGLIEHFTDVESAVDAHIGLLRPNGLLVIAIPNLTGLNYWITRFFHRDVLPLHNLELMHRDRFSRVFEAAPVEPTYCGHLGTFSLRLHNTKRAGWKRRFLAALQTAEKPFELAQSLLPHQSYFTWPWLSPYLVFIGRKREKTAEGKVAPQIQ